MQKLRDWTSRPFWIPLPQTTLSRQLAQMEEEIGVKLFDRGTRKIKLTNEGILLRRRAEEILQLVDKTENFTFRV